MPKNELVNRAFIIPLDENEDSFVAVTETAGRQTVSLSVKAKDQGPAVNVFLDAAQFHALCELLYIAEVKDQAKDDPHVVPCFQQEPSK